MGNPTSSFTLGVPFASTDGRFYTRYPQGNAIGTPGNAIAAGIVANATAPNAIASVPGTGITPYFAMNYGAGASPGGGWQSGLTSFTGNGSRVSYSRIAGGGPAGQDIYRTTILQGGLNGDGTPMWEGDPAWGAEIPAADFGPGDWIFFSFYYRHLTQSNGWDQKMIAMTTAGGHRLTFNMSTRGSNTHQWELSHGGDVMGSAVPGQGYSPVYVDSAVWRYFQAAWRFQTAPGNGEVMLWINNNDFANPTARGDGGFGTGMPASGPGSYWLTFLGYHKYRAAGCQFEHGGFRIARTFDPNFYPG